jgi:hypothetical protein
MFKLSSNKHFFPDQLTLVATIVLFCRLSLFSPSILADFTFPDPDPHSECGSGSMSRIRNTALSYSFFLITIFLVYLFIYLFFFFSCMTTVPRGRSARWSGRPSRAAWGSAPAVGHAACVHVPLLLPPGAPHVTRLGLSSGSGIIHIHLIAFRLENFGPIFCVPNILCFSLNSLRKKNSIFF